MRRLISLVVVALVMAAMMLITALPAFADATFIGSNQHQFQGGHNTQNNTQSCTQVSVLGANLCAIENQVGGVA